MGSDTGNKNRETLAVQFNIWFNPLHSSKSYDINCWRICLNILTKIRGKFFLRLKNNFSLYKPFGKMAFLEVARYPHILKEWLLMLPDKLSFNWHCFKVAIARIVVLHCWTMVTAVIARQISFYAQQLKKK